MKKLLTTIFAVIAAIALYAGCGGSGYMSEYPGEGAEGVMTVNIQGGISSGGRTSGLTKADNFYTDGDDALEGGVDVGCADITNDVSATIDSGSITLVDQNPGYHTMPSLVNSAISSCAASSNPDHCLEYTLGAENESISVTGNIFCADGGNFTLEMNALINEAVVTSQDTVYGTAVIQVTRMMDSGITIAGETDWSDMTVNAQYNGEGISPCDAVAEGSLGFDLTYVAPLAGPWGIIDGIDTADMFQNVIQTDASHKDDLTGTASCDIVYTLPIVISFSSCQAGVPLTAAFTADVVTRVCLNNGWTDCDMEGSVYDVVQD